MNTNVLDDDKSLSLGSWAMGRFERHGYHIPCILHVGDNLFFYSESNKQL